MKRIDLDTSPIGLAQRQHTQDKEKTRRFPALLARKNARMMLSPLAFLRGAAPLYYEILASRRDLRDGPDGEGWLTGDLHLENFGAYRTDPTDHASEVVFGLNDFDDAFIGPLYFDVLRLTTSLLLGAREMRLRGPDAVALCHVLLDAYVDAAFGEKKPIEIPQPVALLLEQVKKRTRKQFLDARSTYVHHTRKFVRGLRYETLSKDVHENVPKAFARYAESLPKRDKLDKNYMDITDAALRIAGTGSLGGLRVAVLVRGHGGHDGGFIFDMKEQGDPSGSILVAPPKLRPAERVITAIRACSKSPPAFLGETKLDGTSIFVRKLMPQEDKLDFAKLAPKDIVPLGRYLGALVGRAHARGAKKMPKAWKKSDRDHVIHSAIEMAALHEGAYLALAELLREEQPPAHAKSSKNTKNAKKK